MPNLIRRGTLLGPLARGGVAEPFQAMQQMLRDMSQWSPFADFESLVPTGERGFLPRTEFRETANAFVVTAEVPGIKQEEIDVSCTGNTITISGERKEEKREEGETYYTSERIYGQFSRSFTLPEGADLDQVNAELKDGVLHVTIPKKPGMQAKHISIQAAKEGEKPGEEEAERVGVKPSKAA